MPDPFVAASRTSVPCGLSQQSQRSQRGSAPLPGANRLPVRGALLCRFDERSVRVFCARSVCARSAGSGAGRGHAEWFTPWSVGVDHQALYLFGLRPHAVDPSTKPVWNAAEPHEAVVGCCLVPRIREERRDGLVEVARGERGISRAPTVHEIAGPCTGHALGGSPLGRTGDGELAFQGRRVRCTLRP